MGEINEYNLVEETASIAGSTISKRFRPPEYKTELAKLKIAFANEAWHVENSKRYVIGLITINLLVILLFPTWYDYYCKFLLLKSIEQYADEKFSSDFLLSLYLASKFIIFTFLLSLLTWLIRIFNNLRRLEITYRDKSVMAETFSLLYVDDDRRLDEHAFSLIFEPTLHQAERKKEDKHENSYEKLIEPLAKLIDKVADKLSAR